MKIAAYKGTDKHMRCLGYQYRFRKTHDVGEPNLCNSGAHACENPLDTFTYYLPSKSRYFEVELDEVTEQHMVDSKRVGRKITFQKELSTREICAAHFKYVKNRTQYSEQGTSCSSLSARKYSSLAAQNCSSLSAQSYSSLAAQDRSSLSAQECSSLAAQDRSSLAAQECSSLSARKYSSLAAQDRSSLAAGRDSVLAAFNSKAKAGMGSIIVIANRENCDARFVITDYAVGVVDGKTLKPDTWYTVKDGQFVEVKDED